MARRAHSKAAAAARTTGAGAVAAGVGGDGRAGAGQGTKSPRLGVDQSRNCGSWKKQEEGKYESGREQQTDKRGTSRQANDATHKVTCRTPRRTEEALPKQRREKKVSDRGAHGASKNEIGMYISKRERERERETTT